MGAQIAGVGHQHARGRGRRAAAPGRARDRPRPHRRRHLGRRRGDDPRRRDRASAAAPSTSRCRWTSSCRPAPTVTPVRRRLPRRDGPPAARGRRRDAALPGLRRPTSSRCSSALNTVADGTAMITENVFESRWMFVNELVRLGADVRTDGHHAVVRGREQLSGAPVTRPRHPGRAPGWCSPGWSPTASPRSARCTTSTAATRASSTSWSRSAPTCAREPAPATSPGRWPGWLGLLATRSRARVGVGAEDQHVGRSPARRRPSPTVHADAGVAQHGRAASRRRRAVRDAARPGRAGRSRRAPAPWPAGAPCGRRGASSRRPSGR